MEPSACTMADAAIAGSTLKITTAIRIVIASVAMVAPVLLLDCVSSPAETSALRSNQRLPSASVSHNTTAPRSTGMRVSRRRMGPVAIGSFVTAMPPSAVRSATPMCEGPRISTPSISAWPPYAAPLVGRALRERACSACETSAKRSCAIRAATPSRRRMGISASDRGASGSARPDRPCRESAASP